MYFRYCGIFQTGGYVVEEVLLPFLLKSCVGCNPVEHRPGVHKILDMMWVCMEVSWVWACSTSFLIFAKTSIYLSPSPPLQCCLVSTKCSYMITGLTWSFVSFGFKEFELVPSLSHLLNALIKYYWFQPVTMDFRQQVKPVIRSFPLICCHSQCAFVRRVVSINNMATFSYSWARLRHKSSYFL